jgi:ATP:corrinoid adenosyltransferase
MLEPAAVAVALRTRSETVCVILTSRNAHPLLAELTEMREVKHSCQKGIFARRGIEYEEQLRARSCFPEREF